LILIALILAIAIAAVALRYALFDGSGEQISISPDDPIMVEAVRRAWDSLPLMLELHAQSREVYVKFKHRTGGGNVEHVWGKVERIHADLVIANSISRIRAAERELPPRLTFPLCYVDDWQVHEEGGVVRGGFTTQAMIAICERDKRPVPREARKLQFLDVCPRPPVELAP
jgi:uncharacterized protein YegJ (DUF2314 family)